MALFGQWLKHQRKARGLTQEALAEQLGYSVEMLHKIEAGRRRPSQQVAERLAGLLDISSEDRPAFIQFARLGLTSGASWEPGARSPGRAPPAETSRLPTNLPAPLTTLIGREREVAAACKQLARDEVRLLTFVGPPGIGKTRLALEVAAELRDQFADGVFLVALAAVSDPDLVVPAVAQTLDLKEGKEPPLNVLQAYLRPRQLLLLLDNFEQVLDAAPSITGLLVECPRLKVMVTSREALHVYGEHQFPVASLATPALALLKATEGAQKPAAGAQPPVDEGQALRQYAAVELFIQRARMIEPDFEAEGMAARAVAEICTRLDGLPLAIELAAAHAGLLTPQAILARLKVAAGQPSLELLSGGARDLPPRQRTLRGAIAWSYNLLDGDEQALFRRLGIFVSGCTAEAVEAVVELPGMGEPPATRSVGGPHRPAIVSVLASLLVKNLLQQQAIAGDESAPRFTMLETIREYALERLDERGEREMMQRQHAGYYLALDEISAEIDNVRAAWRWAVLHGEWAAIGGALAGLHRFYEEQGWLQEASAMFNGAREALAARAARLAGADLTVWARLLAYSAASLVRLGLVPQARELAEEAVAILRREGAEDALAFALDILGRGLIFSGEYVAAEMAIDEAIAIYRRTGQHRELTHGLSALGSARGRAGAYSQSIEAFQEGLEVCRSTGDRRGAASFLNNIAAVHLMSGDLAAARAYFEECLPLCDETGYRYVKMIALENLGEIAMKAQDFARAKALHEESIAIARELDYRMHLARTLAMLGVILAESSAAGGWRHLREALQVAQATGSAPTILDVLDCVATWQLVAGRREEAIALLSLLVQHPATEQQHRDHAAHLLSDLGAVVNSEEVGSEQRKLDDVIDALLAGDTHGRIATAAA